MDDGRFGTKAATHTFSDWVRGGGVCVWRFQECQRQSFNLWTLFDPSFLDWVILISSRGLRAQINTETTTGRLHGAGRVVGRGADRQSDLETFIPT